MTVNGVNIDIQEIKDNSRDEIEEIRKIREMTGCTLAEAKSIAIEGKTNETENNKKGNENTFYAITLFLLGLASLFARIFMGTLFFWILAYLVFQKNKERNLNKRGNDMNKISEDKIFYEKLSKLDGFDSFGTKKEIKYLQKMIFEGEEVFAIASGVMDGNTWLIACTNQRIMFIDCGMIYGVKHSEVMINKVNGISYRNGLMLGEIHIEDGASTRIIKNVQKYSTKPFVDAVHKAMDLSKEENRTVIQKSTSNADELIKFKHLFDMGAITQEEFDEQKKKLLCL